MALILALYAKKDASAIQPIIATTVESFKHIVKLIDDSPAKTAITVIFQPCDNQNMPSEFRTFSHLHKTVCKLEKTETAGIKAICLDGVNLPLYTNVCFVLVDTALNENADEKKKTVSHLDLFIQKNLSLIKIKMQFLQNWIILIYMQIFYFHLHRLKLYYLKHYIKKY